MVGRLRSVRIAAAVLGMSLALGAVAAPTVVDATPIHHSVPVLGYKKFMGHDGKGWGTAYPRKFANGGDGASEVLRLHWRDWGQPRSYASGKRYWFRPHGGYYRRPVKAEARASDLGMCRGRLAYRKLYVRQARKPGAPITTHWRPWWNKHGRICRRAFKPQS
jgi:hypothetical protein